MDQSVKWFRILLSSQINSTRWSERCVWWLYGNGWVIGVGWLYIYIYLWDGFILKIKFHFIIDKNIRKIFAKMVFRLYEYLIPYGCGVVLYVSIYVRVMIICIFGYVSKNLMGCFQFYAIRIKWIYSIKYFDRRTLFWSKFFELK